MVSYKLVDVKAIQSDQPRSTFPESEIDEVANLFLKVGILAGPLIVKEAKPHEFVVLHGHKEYYAAVKAREKDPRKAEMVNAFVVDRKDSPEVEEALLQQISASKATSVTPIAASVTTIETPTIAEAGVLSKRLDNLENRLNQLQQTLEQKQQQLEKDFNQKLQVISERIPKQRSLLEEMNTLEIDKLALRLQSLGVRDAGAVCKQILKERSKKTFSSFSDVVERLKKDEKGRKVRYFSEKTLLKLIDIAAQTTLNP